MTGMGPGIPEANRRENCRRGKNEAVALELGLEKKNWGEACPGLKALGALPIRFNGSGRSGHR